MSAVKAGRNELSPCEAEEFSFGGTSCGKQCVLPQTNIRLLLNLSSRNITGNGFMLPRRYAATDLTFCYLSGIYTLSFEGP